MRLLSPILALLTLLALSGCAGYELGPTNGAVAGARSVQVNLFENQTIEPRLSEAVGQALRKRVTQDGTYRLNTAGGGDIVVTGAIVNYDRRSITFQPGDVIATRDAGVTLTVKITAEERSTGRKLIDNREVIGRTTVRLGSDQNSAERQALPLAAEDLARNITSLLTEGAW